MHFPKLLSTAFLFSTLTLVPLSEALSISSPVVQIVESYSEVQEDGEIEYWGGEYNTGFFISPDGLILTTAEQLITDGVTAEDLIICTSSDGTVAGECTMSVTVIAADTTLNLALLAPSWLLENQAYSDYDTDTHYTEVGNFLEAEAVEALELPYVLFSSNGAEEKANLWLSGFLWEEETEIRRSEAIEDQGNYPLVTSQGELVSIYELSEGGDWFWTTDLIINGGNSGGPVFGEDGLIYGVGLGFSDDQETDGTYRTPPVVDRASSYVIPNEIIAYWFLQLVEDGILEDSFVEGAFSEETLEAAEGIDSDENIFTDVDWADSEAMALAYLKSEGILSGYSNGSFKPDSNLNRAELMKILVEGSGVSPDTQDYHDCFPDVGEEWFAPYVCYAYLEGWVDGYDDGTFKPEQNVNKAEAMKMLVNSFDLYEWRSEMSGDVSEPYVDVRAGQWYMQYVATAKDLGLHDEDGGYYYEPADFITRGTIATNLFRLLILLDSFNS